jgi:pimeloyl-ACP methyl ester carboxylesterase
MPHQKTTVYFVPGMAAGKEIFKNIRLPDNRYCLEILDWLIPEKEEKMPDYARRMAQRVKDPNFVLGGVSFGGVVAQEMAAYLNPKKLVIISSVKCRAELPKRMIVASKTGAYKLIPTGLVLSADDLTKFAIGPRSKKRLHLYQTFLNVRDQQYLDWAIKNMVCWDRKEADPSVIHIHGDSDIVFPIKYIKDCQVIEGGTHIMLLDKGKLISQKLLEVIEG